MKLLMRDWPEGFSGRPTLTVCVNVRKEGFVPSCGRRGALEIREKLEAELLARGLDIDFQTVACLGLCDKGPNARLTPSHSWFHGITCADVTEIADTLERELSELNELQGGRQNGTRASSR